MFRVEKLALFFFIMLAATFAYAPSASAQKKDEKGARQPAPQTPLLTRTTTRHETRRFGYGGSVTLIGAPNGSITIEAWPRSEVDITAEIELRAGTEEELTQLAAVNSFILDEEVNHLRILTTGTHDKQFMKRAAKNFPKKLLGLPWKIDYRIRVPAYTDLEVNAGSGPFKLAGVEGTIRIMIVESEADLTLVGGYVMATIERGTVNVRMNTRTWRGAGADIRLASGELNLELPAAASLDINGDVLRSGQIERTYEGLQPRDRTAFTPRSIRARVGAGGPTLSFTVADGALKIRQRTETEQ
ncbi:MAG TPA: hypothetical protein VJS44_17560 [Pyrinomonadaceae bacterium]|nr:hypothetical protein [Pyrinomonadaceae bacterium]